MKKQLIQFWRSRAARERVVLAGGAALLVFALGYAYGWLPIQRDAAQLRKTLPQLRAQAQQMALDAEEVKRLRGRPALAREGGSLAAVIEERAAAAGLREAFGTIVPQDAGRVRVVLPAVAFDAWLAWLGELQMSHGVRVESARIDAGETAGVVAVDAVLAGG